MATRGTGPRRWADRGLPLSALVAVALLVGGCQYLQSLALGPGGPGSGTNAPGLSPAPSQPAPSPDPNGPAASFDPNDPAFSFDPEASDVPKAIFTHGSATLTIGTQVIKLDHLVGKAYLSDQFGGQASWTDGSGWYAQAFGVSPTGSEFGEDAFVSFDHIFGGQHWTMGDPSSCEIKVTRADEGGLAGSADCPGVRWADLMAAYASTSGPVYIEGQPAFDAKITFEATP